MRGPIALVVAALLFGGCERCARGPGDPGLVPIEQTPSAGPGLGTPPPCRGGVLPDDAHYVAPGLCARVVAAHQGKLRQLTFASNGDLFGVTVPGSIRRYRDSNGDGVFSANEIVEWANTGSDNGHNVDLDEKAGFLYAGTGDGVRRWRWSKELDRGEAPEEVVVGQSGGGNHPYHPLRVRDGYLYVDSGSLKNSMDPMPADYDGERSVIKRFALSKLKGKPFSWAEGELWVKGARNVTGFAWDPRGRMVGVISGMDDLRYEGADVHADNPAEEVAILEQGKAYGFPFCFAAVRMMRNGALVPPGTRLHADAASQNPLVGTTKSTRDDAWCQQNSVAPVSVLPAHSSALGITFFDGPSGSLPERWRGGAFVALHGSWDRTPSTGHKIIWLSPELPMSKDGLTFPHEVVFGGGAKNQHRDGAWSTPDEDVVRPIGVAVSPIDGALYVSSDNAKVALTKAGKGDGVLYRIALRP